MRSLMVESCARAILVVCDIEDDSLRSAEHAKTLHFDISVVSPKHFGNKGSQGMALQGP